MDNKGLILFFCNILKELGIINFFSGNYKSNYCWDGRLMSEYFLFYVRRFFLLVDWNFDVVLVLVYMYFNIGYEFLGKCIWSDDVILLKFFEEMVRSENILSIVFLDYGGKIMDYVIEIFLGSLEVYSLMFFMIILYKVVECFGKNRMNVFILN